MKKNIFLSMFFLFIVLPFGGSRKAYAESIDLKLKINFATNKSEINSEGLKTLEELKNLMEKFPEAKLFIAGHTDSIGADEYNQALSTQRASSVRLGLVDVGVLDDRMRSKGFGESSPVADNGTSAGRAQNRRVVASLFGLSTYEMNDLRNMLGLESKTFQVVENEPEEVKEEVKKEMKTIMVEKIVKRKPEKDRFYATGFIGPHWSSLYYEKALSFEHGKFTALSFGLDVGMSISKRWFADGYFYYLPTEVKEGNSGIDFVATDSIEYENNIYGLRLGYIVKGTRSYRLSLITGVVSHIIGSLERTGVSSYGFNKFTHTGITLGFRLEKRISKNWAFDSDLAYLFPLDVSNVQDADGTIWYRGILGIKRRLSKKFRLAVEYQAVYHESDIVFLSGFESKPEYFIQTLMAGLKYSF